MSRQIYLDYNSTTPVDEKVLEAMLPFFTEKFGNPSSSTHSYGWAASEAVKTSAQDISGRLGFTEHELIFTSGATEAVNLAIKGVAETYSSKGKHLVCLSTEHKAVLDSLAMLEKKGHLVTVVPVDTNGVANLDALERAITAETILVCVMHANNETGVLQPLKEIAEIVHRKKSLLFTDATQSVGKTAVNVDELGADLMAFSAHKFYGPKGTGGLFVRRKNPRVTLSGQISGGGHQRGLRSGTLNVPGIVGMARALEFTAEADYGYMTRMERMRDRFEERLLAAGVGRVNGKMAIRLGHVSSFTFKRIRSEQFIRQFPFVAVSAGSACTSATPEPSHVLSAMGLSEEEAYSTIRFSLGSRTREEDMDQLTEGIIAFHENKAI